ncbi:MAG: DUF4388 domain-containing protein [Cyanobacteria bacterium P01_A01_bin.114]
MTFQGCISDVPLLELFKSLQDNQKTGCLSLKTVLDNKASRYRASRPPKSPKYSGLDYENNGDPYLFWFYRGHLVAATNRSDGLGLLNLIQRRVPLKTSTLPFLLQRRPSQQTLGKFLRENGVLTARQLRSLFTHQVLRYLCVLLQTPEVHFSFCACESLPYLEMTNIKISAAAMMLPGLRCLKNWDTLQASLPSSDSGLKNSDKSAPKLKLNTIEKEVLQIAKGGHSLAQIAQIMVHPTNDVLKIAFRLIFVGLVEEVPYIRFAAAATHRPREMQGRLGFSKKLSHAVQTVSPSPAMSVLPSPRHPLSASYPSKI